MRISDWSSDVCSSDLAVGLPAYAVVAGSGEDAHQAYNRGVAALRKGDARPARIELLNAVKADPQWGSARLLQARSEEHTSELQSLLRISYAVFCLTRPRRKQYPR